MHLHKYESLQTRVRPIIVNPPPDAAVPKPSLISVSRCSIQQDSTAIIAKIDESEIDVSTDSNSSNKRTVTSNMQSKVLHVWSGRSDLESLSETEREKGRERESESLTVLAILLVCSFNTYKVK